MNLDALTTDAGLMFRSFAVRAKDTTKREFTGIGVPYGQTYDLGYGLYERFEPGAVDPADNAKIFWQHREVIGRVTTGKDTDAGHEITAKISDTTLGRDAWTLLEDEVVDKLSIGFVPVDYRTETDEDGNTTIIHTKVSTREFSLVNYPAYTQAEVTKIRSASTPPNKGNTVDPETLTRADLDPITDSLEEMQRAMALIGTGSAPASVVPEYRSIGEFVRAIASGDEAAAEFHRAMATGTISDAIVKDSWVGNYIKLVAERRRVYNTFGTGALPATGMSVEFGKLAEDTTEVAEQVAEGDALAGPGGVKLEIDNATVHTDGGWSELSFQAIQRATVPVLDTLWEAMMMKYAKATEARVRAAYYAIMAEHLANVENPDAALSIAPGADAAAWLDLILDGALIFEERGHVLTGMHASLDQFKLLNRLEDGDGRRLMNVFGSGVNQVGELNLSTVSGSLANVRVELIGNRATTGKLAFYDPVAIKTLESPGAPVRLQDESIINLTKQFSLYGYTAVTTPFPDAILPVAIGA
jgi:uncharacterized protein